MHPMMLTDTQTTFTFNKVYTVIHAFNPKSAQECAYLDGGKGESKPASGMQRVDGKGCLPAERKGGSGEEEGGGEWSRGVY